jgi:hypothetical protein
VSAEQAALARLLLTTIRTGGGLLEVRALARGHAICHWYDDPRRAVGHAGAADPRFDLYVGAVPRAKRGSDRKALTDTGHYVWADCDTDQATAALLDFPVPPTFLIESGGLTATGTPRLHGWWLLRRRAAIAAIEHVNTRLAIALGSDAAVTDATRILRLPGTVNTKTGRPASVLDVTDDVDPPALCDHLPALPFSRQRRGSERRADTPLRGIPATEYVPALADVEVGRNGKARCPFHEERTPSLHVYSGDRGWCCFGCGAGGDVYTFAALAWNLDGRRDFPVIHRRLLNELGVAA